MAKEPLKAWFWAVVRFILLDRYKSCSAFHRYLVSRLSKYIYIVGKFTHKLNLLKDKNSAELDLRYVECETEQDCYCTVLPVLVTEIKKLFRKEKFFSINNLKVKWIISSCVLWLFSAHFSYMYKKYWEMSKEFMYFALFLGLEIRLPSKVKATLKS
jgi:hypothetical protein